MIPSKNVASAYSVLVAWQRLVPPLLNSIVGTHALFCNPVSQRLDVSVILYRNFEVLYFLMPLSILNFVL